ncbi:tRNA pseudouridine synthase [mine drainage metagenome]|uniref:tRNA pseudouridine(55) synthase n=1 Tax=mine drainage metagenome TaxID=410659 RepID=A0A3P3ZQ33_9ZZZZ
MKHSQNPERSERRALTGVILFDKPFGLSSNHALQRVRRLFQALKAGHTGTLDPHATGLLPLCFGEATKYSGWILDAPKTYHATLTLGQTSSTGDGEGVLNPGRPFLGNEMTLNATLDGFLGTQTQLPPMHSALKVQGQTLYQLARAGKEVERTPRAIHVHEIRLLSWQEDQVVIETKVSKGTYIRVLAQDIGIALGCGAYLSGLRRTATGPFDLNEAVTLENLEGMTQAQRDACLQPVDSLLAGLPRPDLPLTQGRSLSQGQIVMGNFPWPESLYRVYAKNQFLGLAEPDATHSNLVPLRMMGDLPSLCFQESGTL